MIDLEDFKELIDQKIKYIEGLKELGNNWVSGSSSTSPNEFVIEQSCKILMDLFNEININQNLPIPKLIMGPIPSGGLGIEFVISDNFKIFLNIYNNHDFELDYESNGYFDSVNIENDEAETIFIEKFKELSRIYD